MIRVAPSVGDVLRERYELTAILGEGSFGQVFRARQIGLESEVAVKVLQPQLVSNEEVLRRFEREVAVVRQLHHPNTIRVLDYGRTTSDVPFYVMEYLRGDPLDEVLAAGPLSLGRARRIIIQVLKSLSEAHEHGIVHRDLKPANLMLCQIVGESDFVKVLDFGIAKAIAKQEGENMTQTGAFLGTPSYTCPEQVLGWRDVDHRADIYATGLILAECLMGRPLVSGQSSFEIVAKHAAPEPLQLPQAVLESPFGEVILKATAKDREQRYQDALEMIDGLIAISNVPEDRVFEVVTTGNHRRFSSSQAGGGMHSLPTTPLPGTFDDGAGFQSDRFSAPTKASASYTEVDAPAPGRGRWIALALLLLGALAAGAVVLATSGGDGGEGGPGGAQAGTIGDEAGAPAATPPPGGEPGGSGQIATAPGTPPEQESPATPDPEPGPDQLALARAALDAEALQSASRLLGESLPRRRTIRFAGEDGAVVWLGERELGVVPFELEVPAIDTSLAVRAELRGYRDESREVSLLRDHEVDLAMRSAREGRPSRPRDEGTQRPPESEQPGNAEPETPPRRNPLFEEAPIFDP